MTIHPKWVAGSNRTLGTQWDRDPTCQARPTGSAVAPDASLFPMHPEPFAGCKPWGRALLALWGLSLLISVTGCGPCGQVSENHTNFLEAQKRIRNDGRPHMRIEIPTIMVNKWLNETVETLPTVAHRTKELGQLAQYLDTFSLDPRKVRLDVAKTRVKFELDVDVKFEDRLLFVLSLGATAPVKYHRRTGVLEVVLEGKNFTKIEPKLTANAVPNLTRSLRRLLPAVVRPLFPKSTVEDLARTALESFKLHAVKVLRKTVLDPMGQLARLRFHVPDLPLEKVVLESGTSQYTVEIWSTIPAPGLPAPGRRPADEKLRISFATPAVVALGNWAMGRDLIPNRFSVKGEPSADGMFNAGLRWTPGPRPLEVNLWTMDGRAPSGVCVHVRADAQPRAELKRKELVLSFEDGKIQEVIGPPLLDETLQVMGVSQQVFSWTKKIALNTDVYLGKAVSLGEISKLKLDARTLSFEFVAKPRAQRQRTRTSGSPQPGRRG